MYCLLISVLLQLHAHFVWQWPHTSVFLYCRVNILVLFQPAHIEHPLSCLIGEYTYFIPGIEMIYTLYISVHSIWDSSQEMVSLVQLKLHTEQTHIRNILVFSYISQPQSKYMYLPKDQMFSLLNSVALVRQQPLTRSISCRESYVLCVMSNSRQRESPWLSSPVRLRERIQPSMWLCLCPHLRVSTNTLNMCSVCLQRICWLQSISTVLLVLLFCVSHVILCVSSTSFAESQTKPRCSVSFRQIWVASSLAPSSTRSSHPAWLSSTATWPRLSNHSRTFDNKS